MNSTPSPHSESELMQRANAMAGYAIGDIAAALSMPVPADLKRNKGWVGILIECCLGASAGSKPEQDFAHLGIELKTLPVDSEQKPLETTFVCVAPLVNIQGVTWETSHVRHKLRRVLWIPIEGTRSIPLEARRIGRPILWSPTPAQEALLKQDWCEIMDRIALGGIESVTAKQGNVLQIRPKAANGQALTQAFGPEGERVWTRPRGFYLRKSLTQ